MPYPETVVATSCAVRACNCHPDRRLLTARPLWSPAGPGLSVTRLGPGRWRLAASLPGTGPNLDVYLAPAEASIVRTVCGADRWDIRIEGMLGEAGVTNLGDCLVAALERGVRQIALELHDPDLEQPLAAAGMLESLGRLSARQGGWPEVTVSGEGTGVLALSQALIRGLTRNCPGRLRSGVRT